MDADVITADIKQAEAVLATRRKEIEAEKKDLTEELTAVEATLVRATETRASIVGGLDPKLLDLFEQLAKGRKGIAICSATRDGLCSVCHVRLRPQVFQLVRQNDSIIQCDICNRILYYVPPPPPVEHAVTHTSS